MAGGVWADVGDEILRVLHSGFIGQGKKVNQFEKVLGVFYKI
jgi:dTDP-4-amino-4,6-dideoxygalactose transaminase